LLYEDEKGPIAAKTYGGTSWSSVQSKVEKAQKTKGILNVFGVYDHTNDKKCLFIATRREMVINF
jgi:hypothetical protein